MSTGNHKSFSPHLLAQLKALWGAAASLNLYAAESPRANLRQVHLRLARVLELAENVREEVEEMMVIDQLGRVVLPYQTREELGWGDGTSLKIQRVGPYVLLSEEDILQPAASYTEGPLAAQLLHQLSKLTNEDASLLFALADRLGK